MNIAEILETDMDNFFSHSFDRISWVVYVKWLYGSMDPHVRV